MTTRQRDRIASATLASAGAVGVVFCFTKPHWPRWWPTLIGLDAAAGIIAIKYLAHRFFETGRDRRRIALFAAIGGIQFIAAGYFIRSDLMLGLASGGM